MTNLAHITERFAAADRYSATSFEAFNLGERSTKLLDPLTAAALDEALAEATSRWGWDRGDRLGIREISDSGDRLHIYAVRKKSVGNRVWHGHAPSVEHQRWLDHIATVDLGVIAGIGRGLVGCERDLHAKKQALMPEGARR